MVLGRGKLCVFRQCYVLALGAFVPVCPLFRLGLTPGVFVAPDQTVFCKYYEGTSVGIFCQNFI